MITLQFFVVHASGMIKKEILMGNQQGMQEREGTTHFPFLPFVHPKI
jgi:hypothetical protein